MTTLTRIKTAGRHTRYTNDTGLHLSSDYSKIKKYYEEAGPDYETWSKAFNMHFGYGSLMQLFSREVMLENMNREVLKRLNINMESDLRVLDMGCGLGATMRTAADTFPNTRFTGVTIVPWQIEKANSLNQKTRNCRKLMILEADFTNLPYPDNSFDAVYALESACHARYKDKKEFISEMMRILKPNGRFVIADGFLKKEETALPKMVYSFYKGICDSWALPCLANIGAFKQTLLRFGATDLKIEDISWKVAPSVLHVPFLISSYVLKKVIHNQKISTESWKHLKGSFLTLVLGLCRASFSYYFVSGKKH